MRAFPARYGMALLRIGFGLYFLSQAYDKTSKHWLTTGVPLARGLRQGLPHMAPWYAQFLQGTVLPHAALFSQLVTLGEWGAASHSCWAC